MSKLFRTLNRRGVIKIGLAYLAVGWLILQVIDVVGGIVTLPAWLPLFALYSLLIGFPIALVLAWLYDITPRGIVAAEDQQELPSHTPVIDRNINLILIGSLALIIALLGGRLLTGPAADDGPKAIPVVSDIHQLTRSQIVFPPTQSPYPIVSDASRLYFNDWDTGQLGLRQLLHAGGEAERLESPFDDGRRINPNAITPDGANLVIGAFTPGTTELPNIWHMPVVGGAPRLIGQGSDVSYSADGSRIVYVQGEAGLVTANPDLSEARKLTSAAGRLHWARFSPDGGTIRYTVQNELRTIWEVDRNGGEPRRLFPEWEFVDHCCGSWTRDGEFYVFQATVDYRTQIWAVRRMPGQPGMSEPARITTGAIDFRRPTISPGGKQIFAVGWQLRGEVVHYDPGIERFVPMAGFDDVSAEWFAFSADSDRVAYISYPEADLWRSSSDGSQRWQLTFPPMRAVDPVWSPLQQQIAFSGQLPREPWRIYLVSADGGVPTPITKEVRPQLFPTWSPDGRKLAFTEGNVDTIRVLDLASGNVADLPRTKGLIPGGWMPDGKHIVAFDFAPQNLVVFNIETHEAEVLAEDVPAENFQVSDDGQYVYVVTAFYLGPDRSVLRINTASGLVEKIADLGNMRIPFGVVNMWVGITRNGEPMMQRDLSIHHIYALDWPGAESDD